MSFIQKIFLTLALNCLGLFIYTGTVQAAVLKLNPSSQSYVKGDSFNVTIDLELSTGEKVDAVDARLEFNNNKLEVTAINDGYFNDYVTKDFDNNNGNITITALSKTNQAVEINGTVATITFRAKDTGTASVNFDFVKEGSKVDSNVAETQTGNDILTNVRDGSYTITSAGVGGTTTTTTSAPSLPTAGRYDLTIMTLLVGFGLLGLGLKLR
jgi:hypothetical protein